MKKGLILYITIAIILVVVLFFIGFNLTNKNNKYNKMEKRLVKTSEKYLGLYPGLYPKTNQLVLTSEMLKNKGYDVKLYKNCSGYVIIKKNNNFYKYEPYIKCKDYTTKGFNDKYIE